MKDFGAWFSEQGKVEEEEPEEHLWLRCRSCGKSESVLRTAYENGDTGWYVEPSDEESGEGICGSGPFCTP